ncbi:acyl carrier protein [Actinoplanes sp. GCM10030250]|uniref:acyl carrier protein n=1 Tax=Actinoplanes sp. GCM10030250 TaxID=3273376 RepID=UPI00361D8FD1
MTTSTGQAGDRTAVEADLLAFLEERTKRRWEPGTDLFRSGAVSSLFAMELVVHLEKSFDVTITGPDLVLDNFRTVDAMTSLVGRLATPKV